MNQKTLKLLVGDNAAAIAQTQEEIEKEKAKVRRADDLDRALCAEDIKLGSCGAAKDDDEVDADAEAILESGKIVATRDRPLSRRFVINDRRMRVKRAITLGNARIEALRLQLSALVYNQYFPEIAALEKRRILLALELQRVNRQREQLRGSLRAAGGGPFLPLDDADLLGLGDREEEVRWATARALEDRILTKGEVEKAKHG